MTVSLPEVLAKKDMEIKVLRKILENNIFVPENNKNIMEVNFTCSDSVWMFKLYLLPLAIRITVILQLKFKTHYTYM